MDLDFWSKVWEEGVIRFHQMSYNPVMMSYFQDKVLQDKHILVPLAGKTKDINYFLEKGAKVSAVEFCEKAIREYFLENKLDFTEENGVYKAGSLTFYKRDFFEFHSQEVFDYVYDRASVVVFNEEKRKDYYDHLCLFIKEGTELLIFTIDHTGPADYGPPHKISEGELSFEFQKRGVPLRVFHQSTEKPSEKMASVGIQSVSYIVMASAK